jgi:hypothetical protein
MLKSLLISAVCLASVSVFADRYPVDDVIDGLRFKASHLEQLKEFFLKNSCSVTVNGNKVNLGAGALRDEALVIGISPENPGNYAAFSKAPKPEFLARVMNSLEPRVVAAQLVFDENDKAAGLQIKVAKAYDANSVTPDFPETFYTYLKNIVIMKFSGYGAEGKKIDTKTTFGDDLSAECNPR